MGFYRFLLSILVLVSHSWGNIYGWNVGVVAVISFYLLSGYVMTILINKYYFSIRDIPTFYLDRICRIFPQFLFYSLLALICINYFDIESIFTKDLTPLKSAFNFLIIPQGYYMWWAESALLIPQAWSLGLELTFYLFIPWILIIFTTKTRILVLATCSISIFIFAYLGFINTDWFGYRLLPGTLFMFLIGSSFTSEEKIQKYFRYLSILLVFTLLFFAYIEPTILNRVYNKEVLLGLILGIIAIAFLKKKKFSYIDEFLGNLSYGIFLNHFIVIWMMQKYLSSSFLGIKEVIFLSISSCILALISYYLIELPALNWRHKIRLAQIKLKNNS